MKFFIGLLIGALCGFLLKPVTYVGLPDSHVYTLYQTNPDGPPLPARFHLATFDARHVMKTEAGTEASSYNKGKCELFRDLFIRGAKSAGKSVEVRCAPGRTTLDDYALRQ